MPLNKQPKMLRQEICYYKVEFFCYLRLGFAGVIRNFWEIGSMERHDCLMILFDIL